MRRRDIPGALIASAIGAGAPPNGTATAPEPGRNIPQTAAERTAGVAPLSPEYPPGRPERYMASGFTYASIDGRSGTDFTEAINRALSIPGQPVVLGVHNYLITNLTMPAAQRLTGQGMHQTNLVCKPGSVGTMFTDQGGPSGAAKIVIRELAFYGNRCNYSHGFRLGYNTVQYGTQGYIDNVWVRDLPAGFPGVDIKCNIGAMGYLCVQSTGGTRFVGSGAWVQWLENPYSLGFTSSTSGTTVCAQFQDATIGAIESEAWSSNMAAIEIDGLTKIGKSIVAFSNTGWTGAHVMQVTRNASSWQVDNTTGYAAIGAPPTITRGWWKDLASNVYWGGKTTHSGEGFNGSGIFTHRGQFGFKLQQLNAFTLRLQNEPGMLSRLTGMKLQHLIGAVGAPTSPTNVATSVRNARSAPTATPTGPDATTAFAGGAKISSASPDTVILDAGTTGAWEIGDSTFTAHVSLNNTGTVCTVTPYVATQNVGGETLARLNLTLRNAATGVGIPWSAALAASGSMIDITVMGFLK